VAAAFSLSIYLFPPWTSARAQDIYSRKDNKRHTKGERPFYSLSLARPIVSCIIQANKQTKEYCPSFLPGASIFNAPLLQRNTAREREQRSAFPLFPAADASRAALAIATCAQSFYLQAKRQQMEWIFVTDPDSLKILIEKI
jgi:hypothetical protein